MLATADLMSVSYRSQTVAFLLDIAGQMTTRHGPDVARGRTLCVTDLQPRL